jgi:hypothetical protein
MPNGGGDFLLVYTVEEKKNLVVFVATGTHAELFEGSCHSVGRVRPPVVKGLWDRPAPRLALSQPQEHP